MADPKHGASCEYRLARIATLLRENPEITAILEEYKLDTEGASGQTKQKLPSCFKKGTPEPNRFPRCR